MAKGLAELGFNVNFGPVADVDVNPPNPVIRKVRTSLQRRPMTVMQYDAAFINAHESAGVLTALKHFPATARRARTATRVSSTSPTHGAKAS